MLGCLFERVNDISGSVEGSDEGGNEGISSIDEVSGIEEVLGIEEVSGAEEAPGDGEVSARVRRNEADSIGLLLLDNISRTGDEMNCRFRLRGSNDRFLKDVDS